MDREEAINVVKRNWTEGRHQLSEALKTLIPEFQESEDEKIRREMIEYFHGCIQRNKKSGFRVEQIKGWIAYIERQKEQKPINVKYAYPKFRIGDVISPNKINDRLKNNDYTIVGFNERLEDYLIDGGNIPSCSIGIEYIDKNYHVKEQKPAEWSEKDKEMLEKVLECIRFAEDRYQLEEEQMNGVSVRLWLLEHINPQPYWKPSAEQMKALLSKLPVVKGSRDKVQDILESLYSDLKNL